MLPGGPLTQYIDIQLRSLGVGAVRYCVDQ